MENEANIVKKVHPVDEILPVGKMFTFGLQHVLAMYTGAVAVPLILSGALGLTLEQTIKLINADLFTCGIATLLQTLGFIPGVGAKIPMIQGVTFTAVAPMIMIGQDFGLQGIYGSIIVAGILTFLAAGWFSKLIRFFPPVVTGTIVTTIGIILMPVAVNWSAGGYGAEDYGSLENLSLAAITLILVLLVYRFGKGYISNISVLLGLIGGTLIAMAVGAADFSQVGKSDWLGITTPFAFGYPTFEWTAIIPMVIVMIVTMVETTGDCIAIGEIVGFKVDNKILARCLRADGFSTVLGGIFNSFPYTAFAQNIGLIAVTNVKSRYVVATSGLILIGLGFFPKLAAIIACIPNAVLGGAGIAMFGMVIASGIRSLSRVQFDGTYNMMVVAISLGFGMIGLCSPTFFNALPEIWHIVLQSGITTASISAVVLNLFLNGIPKEGSDDPHNQAMIG